MKFLKQNHVKFGLLFSGLIAACLLIAHATGDYSKLQGASFEGAIIAFGIPIVVWFFGIRAKKKELHGTMTFKQGFREGFKIALVSAILSPFVFVVFYIFFNPSLIEFARQSYQMTGASDLTVVIVDMIVQFVGSLVMGTILGAIMSFFLKTKA